MVYDFLYTIKIFLVKYTDFVRTKKHALLKSVSGFLAVKLPFLY